MTQKKKKSIIYIAAIIVLGLAALVFLNSPKPITTSDSSFNLAQISAGTYTGSCDNGFVKVRVEVIVENHTIVEVRLLEHDNAKRRGRFNIRSNHKFQNHTKSG
jgi:uncharacterized protein with FMN-binding domain